MKKFIPNIALWMGVTSLLVFVTCWMPAWPCKSESFRVWEVFFILLLNPINAGALWLIPLFYLVGSYVICFTFMAYKNRKQSAAGCSMEET